MNTFTTLGVEVVTEVVIGGLERLGAEVGADGAITKGLGTEKNCTAKKPALKKNTKPTTRKITFVGIFYLWLVFR